MGSVTPLPGVFMPIDAPPSLNLSVDEVQDASGGYSRPADQLKALQARGFTLAFRGMSGKVVLPRAHYDAVVRGQFTRQPAANEPASKPAAKPDRAAFRAEFKSKTRKQ